MSTLEGLFETSVFSLDIWTKDQNAKSLQEMCELHLSALSASDPSLVYLSTEPCPVDKKRLTWTGSKICERLVASTVSLNETPSF